MNILSLFIPLATLVSVDSVSITHNEKLVNTTAITLDSTALAADSTLLATDSATLALQEQHCAEVFDSLLYTLYSNNPAGDF